VPGPSGGARSSAAGASARARYRALWTEHRRERLIAHTVIAGVAGVGAAAVYGWWPVGAAAAVATIPASMVYLRVRPGPARQWRWGAAAERRTGRRLSRLDPAGYFVLHDRVLPGERLANLDHLVIGLTGVYAIVTRRWARGTGFHVDRRRLLIGGRPVASLVRTTARTAESISELLEARLDFEVPVSGIVAVHGARLPRPGLVSGDVVFHRVERLSSLISTSPTVLTSAQVAAIAAVAEQCLPPMMDLDNDGE
jgi:hypothetical protein